MKQEDHTEDPVEVAVLPTSIRYNDTDTLAHPSVSAIPTPPDALPSVTQSWGAPPSP